MESLSAEQFQDGLRRDGKILVRMGIAAHRVVTKNKHFSVD